MESGATLVLGILLVPARRPLRHWSSGNVTSELSPPLQVLNVVKDIFGGACGASIESHIQK